MRRIGLLGGMSWESTLVYYRLINELVRDRLGGLHSADLVLHSLDFESVARLQRTDRWDEAAAMLAGAGRGLAAAGAEVLLVCTNTMHLVAGPVEAGSGLPLLHIADPTARAVRAAGLRRVGLLATAFTMERPFYRERLEQHGLQVLVPEATDRSEVHRVIFDELCRGVISDASRQAYVRIIQDLAARGAQGVILGCTEIGLLIGQDDVDLPVFDTTALHAAAAVEFALGPAQG